MVEITVARFEKFIEAEVRLEIIKKTLEQGEYITQIDLKRILGMEQEGEPENE